MPLPLEVLHTGLRRRKTNQILRHEIMPDKFLAGRTGLHIPRARRVDCQARNFRVDDSRQNLVEGFANGRLEAEAEEGVDDQIRGLELGGEFVGGGEEGDV